MATHIIFPGMPTGRRMRVLLRALAGWGLLPLLLLNAAAAREVRVGIYDNPPKVTAGADGQPSGIMGDLLQEVARLENWTLVPVPCEWEACLAAVAAGTIDLMPDVARSDARVNRYDFHRVPALHSWSQLYSRSDLAIRSMLDLQGKRVAVLEGSSQQAYLSNLLTNFGLRAELIPHTSFDAAFARVATGGADAVAVNHHFGDLASRHYKLVETNLMFQPSQLFYVTGKGRNGDLLGALDRHFEPWQAQPNSPYHKVLRRWAVPNETQVVPKALWWGLGGLVAALLLALAFVALLRREVRRRTGELRASEDKLSAILNSVDSLIYIKDTELRYVYANRKSCELFGQPLSAIVGQSDQAFFDPATADNLRQVDQRVLEHGERLVVEEVNQRAGGDARTYLSVKMPLRRADNTIYALCGISTDITEQRQLASEIHQLAYHDPLTHLANRRQMIERLQSLLTAPDGELDQHALLLINLDNFKDLNDTLGHGAGDQLLQQVAQRLTGIARGQDLMARLGGDEFGLLMTSLNAQPGFAIRQIENTASKLVRAIADVPFQLGAHRQVVTASVGVAMLNQRENNVEDVLKQADIALTQAKAAGRGTVRFFRSDMGIVVAARAALEADLRQGLVRAQFLLHYQPQVDHNGHIFGVEALVRWQHPQRGLVQPGGFIGLAEVSGLIEPLGRWILRSACEQLQTWRHDPLRKHLQVAVNISARQLHHPDFVQHVLEALQLTGADPSRLELELTESHLVEDVEGATAKMRALKAHGLLLSLDDFGTGYSSLNYLKRLPLDQLKIDKTFVHDLLLDANDLSIVKAIIDVGNNLGLKVLAEGVETPSQRDMLHQAGCRRFQGYLFGHPVPAEQLPATLPDDLSHRPTPQELLS